MFSEFGYVFRPFSTSGSNCDFFFPSFRCSYSILTSCLTIFRLPNGIWPIFSLVSDPNASIWELRDVISLMARWLKPLLFVKNSPWGTFSNSEIKNCTTMILWWCSYNWTAKRAFSSITSPPSASLVYDGLSPFEVFRLCSVQERLHLRFVKLSFQSIFTISKFVIHQKKCTVQLCYQTNDVYSFHLYLSYAFGHDFSSFAAFACNSSVYMCIRDLN